VKLQLVGNRGEKFHDPINGVSWLGPATAVELAKIARGTDVLVSASSAESAGLSVREFGALGVPTVALASGGIKDLIEDGGSGFLVQSIGELVSSLKDLADRRGDLVVAGERARLLAEQNRPERVAEKYLEVYRGL
jgi:D-inositol-3-phosphate glycosyltransferase